MRHLIQFVVVTLFTVLVACGGQQARQEQENKTRSARTYAELGMGYLQQGDRKLAIEKLQKAIEADPDYAPAHHSLALAYKEFGQLELAEQHFKKALDLLPTDGALRNNYGAFLCGQDRFADAEEQFRVALRDPTYVTPNVALENAGLCVLRIPDLDKAEYYLRLALKVDPNMLGALLGMARVQFDRKQDLNARGYIQRYEAVAALPAPALFIAVQVEHHLGDHDAAKRYFTRLRTEFPDSAEAHQIMDLEAGLSK